MGLPRYPDQFSADITYPSPHQPSAPPIRPSVLMTPAHRFDELRHRPRGQPSSRKLHCPLEASLGGDPTPGALRLFLPDLPSFSPPLSKFDGDVVLILPTLGWPPWCSLFSLDQQRSSPTFSPTRRSTVWSLFSLFLVCSNFFCTNVST
jgi:hypothetical protein